MGQEFERRFIDFILPDSLELVKIEVIDQTYIVPGDIEESRVRKILQTFPDTYVSYSHTIKYRPENGEFECPIREEETYLAYVGRKITLRKIRTTYAWWSGSFLEVDQYLNESLSDLLTMEIEFDTEADCNAFVPPTWFGREITGEKQYKNKNLWLSLQKDTH